MTLLGRSSLVTLAVASSIGVACTPISAFLTPAPTDEPCLPLPPAVRTPTSGVEPHPIPAKVVAVLAFDGAPEAHAGMRAAIGAALDRRGFSPRSRDLDPGAYVDFMVSARYTPGHPMTATFMIHDIARREIVLTKHVALAEGDLIIPVVLPTALADTLADHVATPPPITDEERWILETLDEPPYLAADEYCEAS